MRMVTSMCAGPPTWTARSGRAQVLGRIVGMGDAAQDPADFPTSPALAAPKALRAAGLEQSNVDYWEVNEAFAVVDMVNRRLLDLDPDRQAHQGIGERVA